MKVTVSREDIEETKRLIDLLRKWEDCAKAMTPCSSGCYVTMQRLHSSENPIKHAVVLPGRDPATGSNAAAQCGIELDNLIATTIAKMIADGQAIIRKHMPIQLDK